MEQSGPILRKTFVTVAVMLAAWVAFIGTVSIVAVLVTSRAVAAPDSDDKTPATQSPEKPATPSGAKPGVPQRI